ncbi:substrate-binding domain-containing protein [Leuconostocaceae bacterium ESL0958]|nr:substrate-binding domain-containing protein [Leuconostocaceae bacterium ESL0958]
MERKKNATIYDVAEAVGVSLATVSRVVNGNQNVRASTREKVLAAIESLGYQPNAVARGLASKKTTTVGVVLPSLTNLFYAELAQGVDDIARMYEYDLLLTSTDDEPERAIMALQNLARKQVDGIIFMGTVFSTAVQEAIAACTVPVVLAGSIDPKAAFPSINIDYRQAFYEVTKSFLAKGHQRIALVLGAANRTVDAHYRLAGYQAALMEAGHQVDQDLIFYQADYEKNSGRLVADLQTAGATALLSYDDQLALLIENGYQDAGRQVPGDLEIVSGNNTAFSLLARPALSSIDQPKYDIGAVAMRLLTKLMADPTGDQQEQIQLPYAIVERASTEKQS